MFQAGKPLQALAPLTEQADSAVSDAGANKAEPKLPSGECSFILPEPDPETGGRQRCICRTFWLDEAVPGSRCQCGHGAWTHEPDPVGSVTMEEHLAVVQKLRWLEDELRKERGAREEMARTYNDGFRSVFNHMAHFVRETGAHMVRLDDKIESVMDKTHDNVNELDKLRTKIESVDEAAMDLENRLEGIDIGAGAMTTQNQRPLSPPTAMDASVDMDPIERVQLGDLPIRDKKTSDRWSARVIFVPSRDQQQAFAHDSVAYKRCESRNLNQELHFTGHDSATFVSTVEKFFTPVLRGRSWMPLMCYRESEVDKYSPTALRQLPPDQRLAPLWDFEFLESQCFAADKLQGDTIFIALQLDELSWNDIKLLPASASTLAAAAANAAATQTNPTAAVSPFIVDPQPFWQHDDALDGPVGYKNLDSMMYDYSDPPPYTSRLSRRRSSLDRLLRATMLRPGSSSSSLAKSPRLPPIDPDNARPPRLPTMEPNRLQSSAVPHPMVSSPNRGPQVTVDSTGRIRSPVPPAINIPRERAITPITHRRGDGNRVQSPLDVLASVSTIEKQRAYMTSVTAHRDSSDSNTLPIFGHNGITATTSINIDSASITSGASASASSLNRPGTSASSHSSLHQPPTATFAPMMVLDDDDEHRDKRTRLPPTRGSTTTNASNASGVSFGSISSSASVPTVPTSSHSHTNDSTFPQYPIHQHTLQQHGPSHGHHHHPPATPTPQPAAQQQVYLSGRSKRKVPTKAPKDPSKKSGAAGNEIRTPLHSFLHRHQGSKDKESSSGGGDH